MTIRCTISQLRLLALELSARLLGRLVAVNAVQATDFPLYGDVPMRLQGLDSGPGSV